MPESGPSLKMRITAYPPIWLWIARRAGTPKIIIYYIPVQQNVKLSIFNAEGRLLRSLVDGPQKIGEYSVVWDGRTDDGQTMASGPYFYRLKVGDFVSSRKMFILK